MLFIVSALFVVNYGEHLRFGNEILQVPCYNIMTRQGAGTKDTLQDVDIKHISAKVLETNLGEPLTGRSRISP
jgi:hypothetical protein